MFVVKRHETSKAEAVDMGKAVKRKPEETTSSPINAIWHHFATSVPRVQAKLKIEQPGDKYEQEADRVAEQVMRMPEPRVQRQVAPGLEEEEETLQAKSASGNGDASAQATNQPLIQNVLSSPGQPLDEGTRSFMEPRFGQDFSGVRVHTDFQAADSARAVNARAYTVGRDVVFGEGEFTPGSDEGKRLVAHELVHVGQQRGSTRRIARQTNTPPPAPVSHRAEIEALLNQVDPVAGVGNSGAAMQLLRGLPMDEVLESLRDMEAHGSLNLLRPSILLGERVGVALDTVDRRVSSGTPREPEDMAGYRERVLRLSVDDRAAVIRFYPDAQAPAEPTLPPGGLSPPPGTPFATLPSTFLQTLWRSYTRRTLGIPGSRENLANAFWSGRPANFWDALTRLGSAIDIAREIHDRMGASGIPWSLIDAVHKIWGGGSLGFAFQTTDFSRLRSTLNSSSRYCEDYSLTGGLWHLCIGGDTPCWREVINGSRGLHFCLGGAHPSVHIDPTQVVEARDMFGNCNYAITSSVGQHFRDLGWVP